MGNQLARQRSVASEAKQLALMLKAEGEDFPGSNHQTTNYKEWMGTHLDLRNLRVKDVVWPGTHDSATNKIGIPMVSRPFAQCQALSIYNQLLQGVRVFDIRVEKDFRICHGVLKSYRVHKVIDDIKKFLTETKSEFVIVEFRTEYAHEDPPSFDKLLIEQFGDCLIPQDPEVFDKTLQELLPQRVICLWKPQKASPPPVGSPLWSAAYIKDNWTDTDLPFTKFQKNMEYLQKHPPVESRKYFYRVENTCTPQADNAVVCVKPVTTRIKPYFRLFIAEAHRKSIGDRLQILSSDFVDADFVNVCVGLTVARTPGK